MLVPSGCFYFFCIATRRLQLFFRNITVFTGTLHS